MPEYLPNKIEPYWQKIWSEKESFLPSPISEKKTEEIYIGNVSISVW